MCASHLALVCMTASTSRYHGCQRVDGDLTWLGAQREAMPTLTALSQRPDLMHLSLSITGLLTAGFSSAMGGAGAAAGDGGAAGASGSS